LDQQNYTHLVRRLELDSYAHPAAFRRRVVAISVGAYVALFTILGVLAWLIQYLIRWALGTAHLFAALKLGVFALLLLPVFWAVLRMLLMRIEQPEGRPLMRDEAPRLFATLDELRKRLNGPEIHHVLVDGNYNAAIAQRPRFGPFGVHTNYLILGLPYMLGTPPKEMLATVAHEYGHLCGSHGKLGAWVYRQRRVFGALYEQVRHDAADNLVNRMLLAMLSGFMPYYNAYTFVMSRQNEYEADRAASDIAGAAVNAQGLVRDTLLGRWIHEEFWPKLRGHADRAERPPFMPFASMNLAFRASHEQWAAQDKLSAAWLVRSDLLDTHPCLRERLEAIGEQPVLPGPPEVTSAERLLGAGLTRTLVEEFDRSWWAEEGKHWQARFRYAARSRTRMAELSAVPLQQVALHELQELALLKAEFESPAAARPVLERLLRQPGGPFPQAAFHYGRILLDDGDARGLDHLREAALHDASLVDASARLGYYYILKTQSEYAARQWWEGLVPEQEAA
jgi:Zn-dependent protease with chaperone function